MYFPVPLLLQNLHKALPSTTSYYKASTKYFPVLLCVAKFAQSMSQYYFALQSLHKVLPSTTLYYKACTRHFPVLLRTTRFVQSTSRYCFVLQSLHNILTSTTLHYKASNSFVLQGLRREYFTLVFTLRAFTQRFFNRDTFPQGNFTQKFLHIETSTHRASF